MTSGIESKLICRMDPRWWMECFVLFGFIMACSSQSSTTVLIVAPSPSSTAVSVAQTYASSEASNVTQYITAKLSTVHMTTSAIGQVKSSSDMVNIVTTASSMAKQSIAPSQASTGKSKPTPENSDEDDKKDELEKKEFIALVSGCCAGGFFALVGTIIVIMSHIKMEKEENKDHIPASSTDGMNNVPTSSNNGIKLNGYHITDKEGLQMDNFS